MPSSHQKINLPVLDLSKYQPNNPSSQSSQDFLKELDTTMREIGFFYVKNHGVPLELQQNAFEAMKDFFKLPLEEKLKIELINSPHFRGYTRMKGETTNYKQDNREQVDLGREQKAEPMEGRPAYVGLRGPNQWPEGLPGFKEDITALMTAMTDVALVLLRAMVRTLDIDEDKFMAMFGSDYGARVKLLRYPAMSNKEDRPDDHGLGVGPHKDAGFLALLLQDDLGGLQVQTQTGEWLDAVPIPDTFVVNIGEIFERLTRKAFVATTHRVLTLTSTDKDRLSFPLFLAPALETRVPQLSVPLATKKVISDVKLEQLLQDEVYGVNELNSYCRSHTKVAEKWYPHQH
ncbi:oxidoreductase [Phycomyces nitens]|nr:oxidoreductase [Phycomyces nitens]